VPSTDGFRPQGRRQVAKPGLRPLRVKYLKYINGLPSIFGRSHRINADNPELANRPGLNVSTANPA
jgi:hypothetical protein